MRVVHRPVKRIDIPAAARIAVVCLGFLGQDRVFRISGAQLGKNIRLVSAVDFGNDVLSALDPDFMGRVQPFAGIDRRQIGRASCRERV